MIKNEEKKLQKAEEELQFENSLNEIPPEDVFAFNELRSCADLFRLYKNKTLEIHPDFQRDIVWKNTDQTRFIDSLVKNLPIPSLCFSLDAKTGKMQVIDGLQRINAVCKFLGEDEWRLSYLEDIDQRISGKTVMQIKKDNNEIYDKVQNVSLPITLLRCDFTKKNHTEYIFTIFRRLNTGGMKLTNQEIRNAVYAGSFNDFLKECNNSLNWKKLLHKTTGQKNYEDRFRSIELILRFFAFLDNYSSYSGKLSTFLNSYMQDHRLKLEKDIEEKRQIFQSTINIAHDNLFSGKNKIKLSAVVLEAILFGIAINIKHIEDLIKQRNNKKIVAYFESVIKNKVFDTDYLSEGLYKKPKTLERFELSKNVFSGKNII